MTGTIVNCGAITLGTIIGAAANSRFRKGGLSEKIIPILALCAVFVGINGCRDVSNPIIAILSLVVGGLIGNAIHLEKRFVWLLNKSSAILSKTPMPEKSIEGIISFSLLSIVGSCDYKTMNLVPAIFLIKTLFQNDML